jgi:hypothetical protein
MKGNVDAEQLIQRLEQFRFPLKKEAGAVIQEVSVSTPVLAQGTSSEKDFVEDKEEVNKLRVELKQFKFPDPSHVVAVVPKDESEDNSIAANLDSYKFPPPKSNEGSFLTNLFKKQIQPVTVSMEPVNEEQEQDTKEKQNLPEVQVYYDVWR